MRTASGCADAAQVPAERAQGGRAALRPEAVLLHRLPATLQCRQVAHRRDAADHRQNSAKCACAFASPPRTSPNSTFTPT